MFNSKSLREEIASKDALIIQLQDEIADYKKSMTSFSNQKMIYENEKSSLVSKYENSIAQLKQEIEIEKKSVAKRVNKELFRIGISDFIPEEISQESNMLSPEIALDKFASMQEGPEKHAFFKANEIIISKAMKNKQKM